MAARDPGSEKDQDLARPFYLAGFFLVSQDGLSERGTTRSLKLLNLSDQEPVSRRSQKVKVPGLSRKRPLGRICMVNRQTGCKKFHSTGGTFIFHLTCNKKDRIPQI